MEKKQSSIGWLVEEINKQKAWADPSKLDPIIEQAKAMHKEEIIKASAQGYIMGAEGFPLEVAHHYGKLWYKNQFEGGNNE